jgi:hypothetical protein
MRWLLWMLRGRPYLRYDGYHCGCCGRWIDESFSIPEYKSCGRWWDTWGVCPNGCDFNFIKFTLEKS